MSKQSFFSLIFALLALPAIMSAQEAQNFGGPKGGDLAPDFTLTAIDSAGKTSTFKLSDMKGKTVVLAFFPGARTSGCTIQLEKFRDDYRYLAPAASVQYIAVSTDRDTALASWSREEKFPFLLVSDAGGKVGALYGAYDPRFKREHRLLYVIHPNGKVFVAAKPFNLADSLAFKKLEAVIRMTLPLAQTKTPIVTYDSADRELLPLLKSEAAKAAAMNKMPVVEFVSSSCPPCLSLGASMADPLLEDAFKNVYLIRLNADVWEDKWKGAGYYFKAMPSFFPLNSAGVPVGLTIDGRAWAEDIPRNQAPPLKQFFDDVLKNTKVAD